MSLLGYKRNRKCEHWQDTYKQVTMKENIHNIHNSDVTTDSMYDFRTLCFLNTKFISALIRKTFHTSGQSMRFLSVNINIRGPG
jgi:hypothetical protein